MPVTDTEFNPSGDPRIHNIKTAALAFEQVIRDNSDPCLRQSVALTNLETAAMWAVKAAAVGDK